MALQSGKNNLGETAVKMNRMMGFGPVLMNSSQVVGMNSKGQFMKDESPDGVSTTHMLKIQKLMVDTFGVEAKANDMISDMVDPPRLRTQTAQRTTKTKSSWPPKRLHLGGNFLKMAIFDFYRYLCEFFDPKKGFSLVTFLSIVIAFAYLIFAKKQSLNKTLAEVFSKSVLLSRSAKRLHNVCYK